MFYAIVNAELEKGGGTINLFCLPMDDRDHAIHRALDLYFATPASPMIVQGSATWAVRKDHPRDGEVVIAKEGVDPAFADGPGGMPRHVVAKTYLERTEQ